MTEWDFWNERYPQALAFTMFDKYQPVELPTAVNEDSRKSRRPADKRLPADTMVLGVWDGQHARAYPVDVLEKAGSRHTFHRYPEMGHMGINEEVIARTREFIAKQSK